MGEISRRGPTAASSLGAQVTWNFLSTRLSFFITNAFFCQKIRIQMNEAREAPAGSRADPKRSESLNEAGRTERIERRGLRENPEGRRAGARPLHDAQSASACGAS